MFQRISQLLAEQGRSQKELAVAVGVSTGNVSDWKAGRAKPSTDVVVRIADFFQVSVDYLLGLSEIRSTKELIEVYKVGIDRWLSDSLFSPEESKALHNHYLDLLFRYKDALNALANHAITAQRKETLAGEKPGEEATIIACSSAKKEIRSLIDWIVALPFYFNSEVEFADKDTSELFKKLYSVVGVLREHEVGYPELSEEESDLLDAFRSLDKSGKRIILGEAEKAKVRQNPEQSGKANVG